MRWPRRLPLSLFIACCVPAYAAAQTAPSSGDGKVQLNQYQPSPFSDRLLRLDGAGVLPFGQFRLGLDLDYALRPLILTDAGPTGVTAASGEHPVLAHAVGGTILASFGLGRRLELGVAVPLTLFQTGDQVPGALEPSAFGLGNVRLGVKARLFDGREISLGGSLVAAVPVGTGTLTHEGGLGGEARLFIGYRRGPLTVGGRTGLRLRAEQQLYDVALGNELTAAAGATWQAGGRRVVMLELAGATAADAPFGSAKQSPLELLAGVRQRFGKTWFTLAGGPGLVNGYGSPLFRLVAAFTWANRPPDSDGDGVPDDVDRCPTVPEDKDDFQDSDGCPDPDNDLDEILDLTDRCPNVPEDRDGFQDGDGCPDPDNDKDGIPDATDKCPDQPETVNDFEDEDGCPDQSPGPSDKDKDGILDDVDECPEEPEDKDGFEDADGCPDLDNDKDGIPDAADKCPLQPETINGIEDDDGCPDKGQAQVRLGKHEIETLQPIYFDTDRSRVRHAFHNTLGQIASLMKAHPEIGRCAIEGHTDDTGPPEWNQKLSLLRAAAVIEFLSNKGVDPKRLVAIGHGEHVPWASNETPEGRAKNRRVVFHIEGVNADELKKQEQRRERRRRIRQQRDSEQERESEQKRNGPAVRPATPAPPAPGRTAAPPPAGPVVPPLEGTRVTPPQPRPVPAAEVVAPAAAVPGRNAPAAAHPSVAPAAVAPGPVAPAAAPTRTRPVDAPPLPRMEDAERAKPAAAPTRTRPADAPPLPRKEDAERAKPAAAPVRAPGRPPKAGPAAAPKNGPPPTLRDLLKLPPR